VLSINYTDFPRILWPSTLFKAEIEIAVPIIISTFIFYISANYVQCRVWNEFPGILHYHQLCAYTEKSDLLIFCSFVTSYTNTNETQRILLTKKNVKKDLLLNIYTIALDKILFLFNCSRRQINS